MGSLTYDCENGIIILFWYGHDVYDGDRHECQWWTSIQPTDNNSIL